MGFADLIDIRRGERRKTLFMAASIMTIVASYMMVKAVRDAVFLAKFSLNMKAMVSIGLALCAGIGTALLTRLGIGRTRLRVIFVTNLVVAASLVLLWLALALRLPGSPALLYVWSSFFGLVVIANFWLLANELYDARAAKRLFAILGAGAILGGIVGGELTRVLATLVGAINLLPIIAIGMVLSAGLAWGASWRTRAASSTMPAGDERPRVTEGFHLLRHNRYLRLVALLLLLSTIATTLIDYQIQSVVKDHFGADRDRMASFFGHLTSLLSIASLLVQLFVTARFLRRFGVTPALFILPFAIFLGAGAMALHVALALPSLAAATMAKMGDGGVRFSLDKAAMELLYLPVPGEVKGHAKPIIDTFVDRLGTALTGVAWIAVSAVSGAAGVEPVAAAALATMTIALAWSAVIILTRRQYLHALRAALPVPASQSCGVTVGIDAEDQDLREVLRAALDSEDPRHALLALDAIAQAPERKLAREARIVLDHPAAPVRARAFDVLAAAGDRGCALRAQRATRDPEPMVRAAAVRYLGLTTAHGADEFVSHADPHVRVAALAHLAEHGPRDAARASGHIAELLRGPLAADPELRLGVARAVGALPFAEAGRHLTTLVWDQNPVVAHAAGASAARVGDLQHVASLLRALPDGERGRGAAEALRGHGEAALGELGARLDDRSLPARARRQIPGLIASIGGAAAAEALLSALPGRPPAARTRIVRALWRLHRHAGVGCEADGVTPLLEDEIACYEGHAAALAQLGLDGVPEPGAPRTRPPEIRLLARILHEACARDEERLFRLLGLCYEERDVIAAYHGLRSGQETLRAHAIELLDNLLENPLKRRVIAALEPRPARAPTPGEVTETLRALAGGPDVWLAACAAYVLESHADHDREDVAAAGRSAPSRPPH